MDQSVVSLRSGGDQLLDYQLFQQAVAASTPTQNQLDNISGYTNAQSLQSFNVAPNVEISIGGSNMPMNDFQAVNYGNPAADAVSACAQNAQTFVSTSLLPKPNIPGQESWDITAPSDVLANQNFLTATQQLGVDTVGSSLRNPSYDIRGDIPNPINIVAPWNMTSITPDLLRRPLQCNTPDSGLYGCPA
jgi:hypothetical protein